MEVSASMCNLMHWMRSISGCRAHDLPDTAMNTAIAIAAVALLGMLLVSVAARRAEWDSSGGGPTLWVGVAVCCAAVLCILVALGEVRWF